MSYQKSNDQQSGNTPILMIGLSLLSTAMSIAAIIFCVITNSNTKRALTTARDASRSANAANNTANILERTLKNELDDMIERGIKRGNFDIERRIKRLEIHADGTDKILSAMKDLNKSMLKFNLKRSGIPPPVNIP